MLDCNNYFIGKIEDLKDLFTIAYVIIHDIYNKLIPDQIKYRRNIGNRTRFLRTKRNLYKMISKIQGKFFPVNKFSYNKAVKLHDFSISYFLTLLIIALACILY